MKPAFLLSLVSTIFLPLAGAIRLGKREDGPPRVVSLNLERSVVDPLERHRLRKRVVQATLDNLDTLYFLNATLGTPPQQVRVHLDTGSSDLWVNTPSSALCQQGDSPCAASGTYSANSSSTSRYIGSYFNISYVDGSGATGDYVTDTFNFGGTSVEDFQFGVGYLSSSTQGILGVGYPVNEVQVGRARLTPYENLPVKMVSNGLINSNAFSLYLNDLDANTGSILFGGVDTEQFVGELQTVPIQSEGGIYAEFLITLTRLELGGSPVGENLALAVLLDSGSSLTYLPDDVVTRIYDQVGAIFQETEQVAFVPCNMATDRTELVFSFSGATIAVPMDELVLDLVRATGRRLSFGNGSPACLFGIAPAGQGTNVLGDTFMRSAYVVYDIDNNEVSLAQSRFNVTQSNVLEITSGDGAVPAATNVKNPVAATAGIIGGGQNGADTLTPLAASIAAAAVAFIVGMVVVAL